MAAEYYTEYSTVAAMEVEVPQAISIAEWGMYSILCISYLSKERVLI